MSQPPQTPKTYFGMYPLPPPPYKSPGPSDAASQSPVAHTERTPPPPPPTPLAAPAPPPRWSTPSTPLPQGVTELRDSEGRKYFAFHDFKVTGWLDPRHVHDYWIAEPVDGHMRWRHRYSRAVVSTYKELERDEDQDPRSQPQVPWAKPSNTGGYSTGGERAETATSGPFAQFLEERTRREAMERISKNSSASNPAETESLSPFSKAGKAAVKDMREAKKFDGAGRAGWSVWDRAVGGDPSPGGSAYTMHQQTPSVAPTGTDPTLYSAKEYTYDPKAQEKADAAKEAAAAGVASGQGTSQQSPGAGESGKKKKKGRKSQ